jgi:acetolactate synthase I/II/III large subunit
MTQLIKQLNSMSKMSKMRVADYIAHRLIEHNITDVFMVTGGGAMHLNDALGNHPGLTYYCNHHEQACAIAAEGYFRASGRMPVVNVTTGPGGTNTLTGVLGQWLDSIPALYISGQVKWETTIYSCPDIMNLRQLGDQEGDIINIVKPITKYAVILNEPLQVKKVLDKALYIAKNGRPGPVWIDIPLDVQGAIIDPSDLEEYNSNEDEIIFDKPLLEQNAELLICKLLAAKSPVLFIGNGIRLSGALELFDDFLDKIKIPVLNAISGHDLIETDNSLFFGRPGICGDRLGNIIIQNCDLLIVLGTRMGLRQATYNFSDFGRNAYKIMVDIDEAELNKPTVKIDLKIHSDLKLFLNIMLNKLNNTVLPDYTKWIDWGSRLKTQLPTILEDNISHPDYVNSYFFAKSLFDQLPDNSTVVTGNGTAYTCTFQAMKIKKGMRVFANQGCAAMGYDLPAAIGACIGKKKEEVILITGDGSIMMNLQELQTIFAYDLPIKIFILENNGYVAIRTTQSSFFDKRFVGESPNSRLFISNFEKLAKAFGIEYFKLGNETEVPVVLQKVLQSKGPVICEIKMDPEQTLYPKVASFRTAEGKMISKPMEDMFPFLPEISNSRFLG